MNRLNNKMPSIFIYLFMIGFSFLWLGCPADINNPPPSSESIDGPKNLTLSINAVQGGNSYSTVNWEPSADQTRDDFRGYRVMTHELNSNNEVVTVFQVQLVNKNVSSFNVDNLVSGTRYRTSVSAELNDGTASDTVSTSIYGAVFYRTDGMMDEFTSDSSNSKSGYGWPTHSQGYEYEYITSLAPVIDVNLRRNSSGKLMFYNPLTKAPGSRKTKMLLVGSGEEAFNQTDLREPDSDSLEVALEKVFLLKNQDNYYIKVYVKSIETEGNNSYSTIKFEYKVQTVQNLRVL